MRIWRSVGMLRSSNRLYQLDQAFLVRMCPLIQAMLNLGVRRN